MAAEKKVYPSKLYAQGDIPVKRKSLNHNCKLNEFTTMKLAIGAEVFNDIRDNYSVGVFLKLAEMKYTWSAKVVDWLLINQLDVSCPDEVWSLVGSKPIRFSLNEFEEITHLHCGAIGSGLPDGISHEELWDEIEAPRSLGPDYAELKAALSKCSMWSHDKKRMLGLLFILTVGVFGKHRVARLPLSLAKLVMDRDAFERYPWGTQAFKVLVQSIKAASYHGLTYILHGPVHVLLIWAYESIPALRDFAKQRADEVIPLIRWEARRIQFSMEDLLAMEIQKYKSIRVERHMVVKPDGEIYPPGSGMVDPKVDSMIRDILNGCLDESFWGVESAKVAAKNNKQQSVAPPKSKRPQKKGPPTDKKRRKVVTSEGM